VAAKKNRALYQFKVTLRGIHPPIWRRIQVWEDATLAQLASRVADGHGLGGLSPARVPDRPQNIGHA